MEKLKGYLEVKEGEITGIASTEATDRDGEVIKQSGWDLSNFNRNPVLMLMHNYQEFPVGKITDIGIEGGKLTFKAIFTEATQKAIEAYALVKEGILSAFSVGFIPREYDPNNNAVITKAELLEISLVPVPANPDAIVLAKAFKKNEIAEYIVKNFLIEEKKEAPVVETPTIEEKPKEDATIETEAHSAITTEDTPEKVVEVGKEGEKANEIDLKLIQATVGHLQVLCRELKKKGGVNL